MLTALRQLGARRSCRLVARRATTTTTTTKACSGESWRESLDAQVDRLDKRNRRRDTRVARQDRDRAHVKGRLKVQKPEARRAPRKKRQTMDGGGCVFWVRFDARIDDNPALLEAARGGGPLTIAVTWGDEDMLDDENGNAWALGEATRVFYHHSLDAFDRDLRERFGQRIVPLGPGDALTSLRTLLAETRCKRLVYTRRHEPAQIARDDAVHRSLQSDGIAVTACCSFLLHDDISKVKVDLGTWRGHFGTLMPFYLSAAKLPPGHRRCAAVDAPSSLPKPHAATYASAAPSLAHLGVCSSHAWASDLASHWTFGERAGRKVLDEFISAGGGASGGSAVVGGLARYEKDRSRADVATATTRLAPYLRLGVVSPRRILTLVERSRVESKTFWRRLFWRDLAYWQLRLYPEMATEPIRPGYCGVVWRDPGEDKCLSRWKRGQTGWPLVDAGMRELYTTGFMHQSVRMSCACYLTDMLNVDWRHGARWFHHTLCDADFAINSMMWQNAGKAGLDQWNFSVSPASKASDPTGAYIKKWVPELRNVPTKFVHEPWLAPADLLKSAGVVIGTNYPQRHEFARDYSSAKSITADALRGARQRAIASGELRVDANGYDMLTLPGGSTQAHDGKKWRVFTVQWLRGKGAARPSSSSAPPSRGAVAPDSKRQRTIAEAFARAAQ
ncbi:hypothetical protein PPROV_000392900 [Pycnococcus provasolii]|uniref:Photolyase/cryptochrome alpha/beta domain-containing protein n=1 Tax=Pycnococcus provasolii TaxID=41880 RepID=A0A830HJH9_9CHLO|nr:hypothetical protein PPROV_000392900 [Pycnococcus provasolii]